MPVIPFDADLLHNERAVYQFLLHCQEKYEGDTNYQVISFSQKIEPIDPLAVLAKFIQKNQIHFYWENSRRQEAIAAIGTTHILNINSGDRFLQSKHFIQDCLRKTLLTGAVDLPDNLPFLFSSFTFFDSPQIGDSPFPCATVFLPRFQVFKNRDTCYLTINIFLKKTFDISDIFEIKHQIKDIYFADPNTFGHKKKIRDRLSINCQNYRAEFTAAVTSALEAIENKKYSKIVLSNALEVFSARPFRLIESLNNLRKNYGDCYVFSTSNGRGNNFIGASPERLISINNRHLVTDALAGSAPRGKTAAEDDFFAKKLLESEKEIREHQAVSEFILQCLGELGIEPERSPLQLLQLSNIQHLWTPISAQLPENIHPIDIVAQLHPTPAVAGVPREIVLPQIRHYETFDRALYAAPLGWVSSQGNSEFIVGIRSALIKDNKARLYAGAGIVAGSDPNKELAEIELKFQALLRSLL
jgi:menaquinone-specific isochorismate synthase